MFDFDTPVCRKGTNSLKWDLAPCDYPMWVADMDFAAAPPVREALQAKLDTGVFGYQIVPDAFGNAVADWWRTRHGWTVDPKWVIFCTGVVPAVTTCVKCLTNVGDNVVLFTPVYDIFFHSVENTGRNVLACDLAYNGAYSTDLEDLERKLSHPDTTMLILCNPHNPTGQVWSEETLTSIGFLCQKHGVRVLSDEIHCDLTLPGVDYVPYGATLYGKDAVVCVSASKAFNLAGLQGSAVIVPEPHLKERVERALNACEVAEPNLLAIEGTVAAFEHGAAWLDALRAYLAGNRAVVCERLAAELPQVRVVPQQATYLMWLDMTAFVPDTAELCRYLRREMSLWVTAGAQYRGNGAGFIRLNIACPRVTLREGLGRLVEGIRSFLSARE